MTLYWNDSITSKIDSASLTRLTLGNFGKLSMRIDKLYYNYEGEQFEIHAPSEH